ncbi:MAG: FtsH protease activity modulator HflK [Oscillospiraceae bacterium]|nr:FtsH protease activity modulator HflK [Oscillospiraceae bacterium]
MNFNNTGWEVKKPDMDPKQQKKIKNLAVTAVVVIVLIMLVSQSYYLVSDQQQAVITTFGELTTIKDAGLHFKIPFIQRATLVDVNVSLRQTIGYHPDSEIRIPGESKMITGDFNIVNIDFYMEYRISDPYKYLFNSQVPDEILKNIAQSKIRNVISTYRVDPILTVGKAEIQNKIRELIREELDSTYDIGLILTNIIIQDAEPPTPDVIAAFKSVETARQDRSTARNQAQAYRNERIPAAAAEANRLIENAEFVRANRVNEANMLVAMFNAMYGEYSENPGIHRQRMYFEMLEAVLPGVKVIINAGDNSDVSMMYPLDDFLRGE